MSRKRHQHHDGYLSLATGYHQSDKQCHQVYQERLYRIIHPARPGRRNGRLLNYRHGMRHSPEEHENVFKRFVKLNEYVQGTGLGLSITRLIITKLGGKIWIDGNYQKGARFVFTLPVCPAEQKNNA